MRKVLIVSFYDLKAHFLHISNIMVDKFKFDVEHYPLYMYCYDKNSKIKDYQDNFSEYIKEIKPDIILWFFTDVPVKIFRRIRKENKNTFFVIFNFDDPLNLSKSMIDKCSYFDMICTPSMHNIKTYQKRSNVDVIEFIPFGYEKLDKIDSEFNCDISFICDQIYDEKNFPSQIIPTKKLIKLLQDISERNNLKFNLYGREHLKILFPKNYCGDLSYLKCNEVITGSKINIQSHPFSRKKLSINNRVMTILGYGGLLLIDNCKDFKELFGNSVEYYDNDNLEEKILEILNNNNNTYDDFCIHDYSWEKIIDKIFIQYNKDNFDLEFYGKIYGKTKNITFNDWLDKFNTGCIEIPYYFDIPNNFNLEGYKEKFKLDNESDEYCYLHWFDKQDMDYMKKENVNSDLSGENMNIMTANLFELFSGFNKIFYSRDLINGIKEIDKVARSNPRLKINECLDKYINTTLSK
jgi:hypothetical protein